jgi:hypothetical protein
MKKRLISLLLVLSMCLGLMTSTYAASASDYSDLKADAWYMEYVPYMIRNGYMSDTGYGKFEPNATVNRAMFVTILGRIAGVNTSAYNGASKFTDVPEGQWYTPYVNWAVDKGISDGNGNGTFSPKKAITREQMATMIYRYIKAYGMKTWDSYIAAEKFKDSGDISSYATNAVELVRKAGIMDGYEDHSFLPKKTAKRAEAAAVCYRLIAATEKTTENVFEEFALDYSCNAGVGNSYSSITINSDGSFTGGMRDLDGGETGSGYPGGTEYSCTFSGRFSTPQRVSEHVYVVRLEEMNLKGTVGEVYYEWGKKVITTEPNGFDIGDLFYLYLPGIASSNLSEYFLSWDPINRDTEKYPYFPFYGLYDVGDGNSYYGRR